MDIKQKFKRTMTPPVQLIGAIILIGFVASLFTGVNVYFFAVLYVFSILGEMFKHELDEKLSIAVEKISIAVEKISNLIESGFNFFMKNIFVFVMSFIIILSAVGISGMDTTPEKTGYLVFTAEQLKEFNQ